VFLSFFLSFFFSFNLFSTICICIDVPCGIIWRQGRRSTQVIVVVGLSTTTTVIEFVLDVESRCMI
jgi:hypothetical protein